jgi:crotonobetainyl-CoA:carnitine CoA-transferase CaiB-like acyl-CoA transferase
MAMALPLHGLTIIELGTSVAAPYGGQVLAELGGTVIKIENPQGGDDARHWGPPFLDGVSPVFNANNRNKRSATVDLKDAGQRASLRRFIVEKADVVLQNLRPGLVERYGLDAKSLRAARASLIYCNLAAYGATGPAKDRPGYDPLMQACGGIMSVTGHEGAEPVRVGPSLVDQGAGMWAVIGILAALYRRQQTGEGCEVDTSLYETAIGWLLVHVANFLVSGNVPKRLGSENAGIAPYKAFEAADGWIVIAAGNDGLFRRLTEALARPDLAADARFAGNPDRVRNRIALNDAIAAIVRTAPRDHWQARLDAAGVPCAPVKTVDQVLADPQFAAVDMLQTSPDGAMSLVGLPLQFDGVRPPLRNAPPALGDANALIFGDMAKAAAP